MRKFENCDVLAVLHEIMLHNTKHFQEDFVVDEEILREAAEESNSLDRRYLWMSRPCGTHCLKEKDVFLYNSPEYSTWTAYADTADKIIAYAVQLNGYTDGVLKGDLYELDYASHCAMAEKLRRKDCAGQTALRRRGRYHGVFGRLAAESTGI